MAESAHFDPVCQRPAGLISPVRCDPKGLDGPTRKVANGPHWRRCGSGLYVPCSAPSVVEQRILEAAGRLAPDGSTGCVTGWAALRWRGAAYFDGLSADGVKQLPIELGAASRGHLRSDRRTVTSRHFVPPGEAELVGGVPVATVQRALYDEIRRRASLIPAVQAIDMAAAARLISTWLFACYVGECNGREAAPLARHAVGLAVDESCSPRETWMRLVWRRDAGLPPPCVNAPVYDLAGRLLGVPDLFDPEAGLVGEYDGAAHKARDRHRRDVAREERFRAHGLECATVVSGDSRAVATDRILAARSRAHWLRREECAWTLERPPRDPAPESLDAYFERMGMVEQLTHK